LQRRVLNSWSEAVCFFGRAGETTIHSIGHYRRRQAIRSQSFLPPERSERTMYTTAEKDFRCYPSRNIKIPRNKNSKSQTVREPLEFGIYILEFDFFISPLADNSDDQ
jgi:hypothetical protein